ncbi:MAG: VWA domain-containing protein [Deltaproteobacteria bacterium]|nr:VWA domain-containing protein [Deltaproteobacteria bacterium]
MRRRSVLGPFALAAIALAVCMPACTDVDIFETPGIGEGQLDNKLLVRGEFCTEHPDEMSFPVKILFMIDCSSSMNITDPPPSPNEYPGRVQAVWEVIQKYRFDPGVEFGIIRFEGAVNVATQEDTNGDGFADRFGFVNDLPALLRALNQLQAAGGNTNYQAALGLAEATLAMDMSNSSVDERARSKYVVIFLTDGLPYPVNHNQEVNTYFGITRALTEMMNLPKRFDVEDFKVHTAFLSVGTPAYVEAEAEHLLKKMAEIGRGTFRNFHNGEEINFLDIDYTSVKRMYSIKDGAFVVSNANAHPAWALTDAVDTDGDGLIDALEQSLGTDIGSMDTDGDGFNDLLEYNLRLSGFDPLDPDDADCSLSLDRLDRDGDGLLDCEERFIGTNPDLFDTDADGLPDPIEVRSGTNPVWADAEVDMDFDGSLNFSEVAWHTNPTGNDAAQFSKLAYRYRFGRQPGIFESRFCYHFEVDNITLVGTDARVAGAPEGYNDIMVYAGQIPLDDPEDFGTFRVACARVRYVPRYPDPDLKYPPNGEVEFEQKDFKRPVATRCSADVECPHHVCDPRHHLCQAPLGDKCDESTPCPHFACETDRSGESFCIYPVAAACLEQEDCPPYPVDPMTNLCMDPTHSSPVGGICPRRECIAQYYTCEQASECPEYGTGGIDPECLNGYCRKPCEDAGDCNPGETCDPDELEDYSACSVVSDCPNAGPNTMCRDGVCRDSCFSDEDCTAEFATCEEQMCVTHHCVDHHGGTCARVPCTDDDSCPIQPCDPEVHRCRWQPCLDSRECDHQHCELVLSTCMGPRCEDNSDCRGERGFTCNEIIGDACDRDVDCPYNFCTVEVFSCAVDEGACEFNTDCTPNLCTRNCDDPETSGVEMCCSLSDQQNPERCNLDVDCSFNYCKASFVCANDESVGCTMSLDCPQTFCKRTTEGSDAGVCLNNESVTCSVARENIENHCHVGMCSREEGLGTCDTLQGEPCSSNADCPPYRCNLAVGQCYYPVLITCSISGTNPDLEPCPTGLTCMDDPVNPTSDNGICGALCSSDANCPPALCKGKCIPQLAEDRMRCTDWFDAERDCRLYDHEHSGEPIGADTAE